MHQAERLLELPDRETLKGKRDRALLALLVGCGVRREDLAALEIERIQQRDTGLIDLVGRNSNAASCSRHFRKPEDAGKTEEHPELQNGSEAFVERLRAENETRLKSRTDG
ncbi:MAG TPA: hypothetical protein VF283_17305 [Bryobacteraceae bacterium]